MMEFTVLDIHTCSDEECKCPQWHKDNPRGRANLTGTKVIVTGVYSSYGTVFSRVDAQSLMREEEWQTAEE